MFLYFSFDSTIRFASSPQLNRWFRFDIREEFVNERAMVRYVNVCRERARITFFWLKSNASFAYFQSKSTTTALTAAVQPSQIHGTAAHTPVFIRICIDERIVSVCVRSVRVCVFCIHLMVPRRRKNIHKYIHCCHCSVRAPAAAVFMFNV